MIYAYTFKSMDSAVRSSKLKENIMSQSNTYAEIANDYALWAEFVDTDGAMTEAEFVAMTEEAKIALQVDAFGAENV